ncbi:MAG: hypothetical protein ABH950_10215 [Candidatus Altiarchaeota archaeon]
MRTFSENISTGSYRSYGVSKPVGCPPKKSDKEKELERQIKVLKDLLMWPSVSKAVKKAADDLLKQLQQKREYSENVRVPQGNYYHSSRGWY